MDDNRSKFDLTGLADLQRANAAAAEATTDPQPQPRYVSYRSLLLTGRAVKRHGTALVITTAGESPQSHRLVCASKAEAKRLMAAMATDLRTARSDDEYNRTLIAILADVKRVWPQAMAGGGQPSAEHVHSCGNEHCDPGEGGVHPCGFYWREHQLTVQCVCGPETEPIDASGTRSFVVHRDMMGKVKVYV